MAALQCMGAGFFRRLHMLQVGIQYMVLFLPQSGEGPRSWGSGDRNGTVHHFRPSVLLTDISPFPVCSHDSICSRALAGDTPMRPRNWELRFLPSYLRFFMSLNQQAKKGIAALAGATDQGLSRPRLYGKGKEELFCSAGDVLGHLGISMPCE